MFSPDPNRYDGRMPYRRCGGSGLKFPSISLGCWHNFGQIDDQNEARSILHRAFDQGVTHFDLANNYGPPPGSAEENVGRILAEDFACHRDELLISTKSGYFMWDGPYGDWGSRKQMLSSLDQSLRRLRLDYVDVFYHHRSDPETPLEESMSALATAVEQGKALYVGLSNYPYKRLKKAVRMLNDMGVPCLIYQPSFSILNRRPEPKIHPWLQAKGIGSIPFSPLAQGMLSRKYLEGIPEDSRAGRRAGFLTAEDVEAQIDTIRALNEIAKEKGMPLHHLALRWVLDQPGVTSALIGARTTSQLDDSLAVLDLEPLDKETRKAIDEVAPMRRK